MELFGIIWYRKPTRRNLADSTALRSSHFPLWRRHQGLWRTKKLFIQTDPPSLFPPQNKGPPWSEKKSCQRHTKKGIHPLSFPPSQALFGSPQSRKNSAQALPPGHLPHSTTEKMWKRESISDKNLQGQSAGCK